MSRGTLQSIRGRAGRLLEIAGGEWQRLRGRRPSEPATTRQALDSWVLALGPLPAIRGRILITALRNHTWIEWAAYCACVFRQMGFASTLVFQGSETKRLFRQPSYLNFWDGVRRIPDIELVDLEQITAPAVPDGLEEAAKRASCAALAYDLHIEEADVRADLARFASRIEAYIQTTVRTGAALHVLIGRGGFHRFICYSGLIGVSPGLLQVARRRDLPTICLEGWAWRPGHMIYNLNAPALEYNIMGWLHSLGKWDEAKECEVDAYLKFLDGEKREGDWLDNFYRIQRDKVSADLPADLRAFLQGDAPVFLLAPNVIGDSSMLCRETIFDGQQSWTREVIQWFAARPHLKLVIRAHPAERWVGAKCVVHMGAVAKAAADDAPNVFVIDSEAKLNTFALIPFARAGLAWLSSAGVDFVVRGLPAMVAARPKYEGMGIVVEPASRGDYFAQLERWAEQPSRPTRDQVTQGKRYLHVVFKGFSFEAGARNYRATGLHLGAMPNQAEHDHFYRILVGDSPMPDQL